MTVFFSITARGILHGTKLRFLVFGEYLIHKNIFIFLKLSNRRQQ